MKKIAVYLLVMLCLCSNMVGCSKKAEAESAKIENKQVKNKNEKVNEKKEYQIIGNKTDKAIDIFMRRI